MPDELLHQYFVLFPNHHEGLKAHKLMKEAGLKCSISPTPREASASCGISLLITKEMVESAREVLEINSVKTDGIVEIVRPKPTGFRGC